MGDNVYSISRLDTINACLYEAYNTYRLGDRGEKNIYTYSGSLIHEILEDIVNGKATEEDLYPAMQRELKALEEFGIDFPKDPAGGMSIRNNWIANMTHFCNTYKSPRDKILQAEVEVNYTTPKGYKLVGYVDLLRTLDDGSVEIYDYKSSSLYKMNDYQEKGHQLCLYALALESQGFTVRNVNWIFMKYVTVSYMGYKTSRSKEKTMLKKNIERRKIVSELKDSIQLKLLNLGYSNLQIDFIIEDALKKNEIPAEVADFYKVRPCVITYNLTDIVKAECIDYIEKTIELWESLSDDDCKNTHRDFFKTQKNGKVVQETHYCRVLCPHKNHCPHFQDFLATQQIPNNSEEELF